MMELNQPELVKESKGILHLGGKQNNPTKEYICSQYNYVKHVLRSFGNICLASL